MDGLANSELNLFEEISQAPHHFRKLLESATKLIEQIKVATDKHQSDTYDQLPKHFDSHGTQSTFRLEW